MSCGQCKAEDCIAPEGWLCENSGNFYTTGEYSRTVKEFDIHGASFIQKVDSVKHLLDNDTIQILKVLLQDNEHPFTTWHALEVIYALDTIQSRLSNDNITENSVINSYRSGSDKND